MTSFGRLQRLSPVILAGLTFLIFAPVELFVGYALHNPAISANAAHDAFDGLFFLVGGSLDALLERSRRHSLYCWSRKGISIAAGLLASVFVGIGLFVVQDPVAGAGQLVAALVLGPVSMALNWYWHRRVESHGDEHHHGYDVHLVVDASSGLIVVVAAVVVALSGVAAFNLWAGYVILGLAAILGLRNFIQNLPGIMHRERSHSEPRRHVNS